MKTSSSPFIDRDRRIIILTIGEVKLSYPLNPAPEILLDDLLDIKESDNESVYTQRLIEGNMLHKPIVSTINSSHPFTVNSAPKIVRVTLKDKVIQKRLQEIEGEFLSFQGKSYSDTLEERIELYQELYMDTKNIDRVRLGAVEMFGETTYSNILRDPRVTLCFSWYRPRTRDFLSFHINCIAEVIPPGNTFYKYMRIMRSLFSERFLDLGRPEYTCAYKLWVSETKEKTLTDKTGFSEQ